MNRRARGTIGENLAVEFLRKRGYRILERNFRFNRGEVDIVADDRGALVFVEVKARRSLAFGDPEEAVTPAKRRQLRTVAEGYLFSKGIDDRECRFDVVAIRWSGRDVQIDHFVDAF